MAGTRVAQLWSVVETAASIQFIDSAGHFAFKPIVQNGGTKTPELSDPRAYNLSATGHLLESLGMNFQESGCLICVQELLKVRVSVFNAVGWFGNKPGPSRLRESLESGSA
jgi:hypothetical protein